MNLILRAAARRGRLRAGGVLLAVVACSLSLYLGHRIVPPVDDSVVHAKFERIRELSAELNVVFVGTSRTYRSVSPAVFDEALADRGFPVRSFNLGLQGASFGERLHVLRRLVQLQPRRPGWVLLEYSTTSTLADENRAAARSVYWHDARSTWLSLRLLADSRSARSFGRRWLLRQWRNHLAAFGHRLLNLGRLETLAQTGSLAPATGHGVDKLGPHRDGYLPLDVDPSHGVARRRMVFLRDAERYRQQLGVAQRRGLRLLPPRSKDQLALAAIRRVVEAADVEVILVQFPLSLEGLGRKGRLDLTGQPLGSFSFSDPRRQPELYDPNNRWDAGHLNQAGTIVFSRALAARFAAHLGSVEPAS